MEFSEEKLSKNCQLHFVSTSTKYFLLVRKDSLQQLMSSDDSAVKFFIATLLLLYELHAVAKINSIYFSMIIFFDFSRARLSNFYKSRFQSTEVLQLFRTYAESKAKLDCIPIDLRYTYQGLKHQGRSRSRVADNLHE